MVCTGPNRTLRAGNAARYFIRRTTITQHARLALQQRQNVFIEEESAEAEEEPQAEVDERVGVPDAQVRLDDGGLGDGDLQDVLLRHAVAPGDDELFAPVVEKGAELEQAFAFGLLLEKGRDGNSGILQSLTGHPEGRKSASTQRPSVKGSSWRCGNRSSAPAGGTPEALLARGELQVLIPERSSIPRTENCIRKGHRKKGKKVK